MTRPWLTTVLTTRAGPDALLDPFLARIMALMAVPPPVARTRAPRNRAERRALERIERRAARAEARYRAWRAALDRGDAP